MIYSWNMSPERRRRESDPYEESAAVWRKTVLAQQEGLELTEEQIRALELRRTSLDLVGALEQLTEDPTIKDDPAREAEVTAQYWHSVLRLQDMGITENVHVGDAPESFNNPKKVAEYVAGQLIGIEGERIPNVRQALFQAQEHSEGEITLPGATPERDISMFVMPTKNLSPNMKNWIVLRSMVNVTHRFLASDLDKPKNPQA